MLSLFKEYPTRKSILLLLKEKGPMTIDELSSELNITRPSIRQHLFSLGKKGLIDYIVKRTTVGRPPFLYKLSEKAEGLFHGAFDRRRRERVKKETFLVLNYQGRRIEAESTDFSKEGLGIKISGEAPVQVGETMGISAHDLQMKAKVMWVNKLSDTSLIGLQRIN
jgi:DNA-binding transcriptional ArsR family regulator